MTGSHITVALAQRSPLPPLRSNDGEAPPRVDIPRFREDVARTLDEYPGIELLVYPEMHLHSADHLPAEERDAALLELAVPLDAPLIEELGSIAAEHGIWLIPGSIGEQASDGYFNTELLFAPDGTLTGSYRKMFPWRPHEPHQYGTEFVTAVVSASSTSMVVGLSNCYDSWFPEHARQLAWLGAQAVLNVVKTTSPDREQELVLARANAIVNQVFMLSVNCAAPVGRGRSIAVDPEGYVLAEAGLDEQTLVVRLEPERFAQVRDRGTCGSNRPWNQFESGGPAIALPLYGGHIDPATWPPRSSAKP